MSRDAHGPDSGYLQYIHVLDARGVVVYIKETVNYAILTSDKPWRIYDDHGSSSKDYRDRLIENLSL
jgi:hypothetical protein